MFRQLESGGQLERLAEEITTLAAHISAITSSWLGLIAEFDRLEGYWSWGCVSCVDWLAWQCSMSPTTAREHVRIARRLEEMPLTQAAYGRGELSYSKVRALTRIEAITDEAGVLELARHSTASQLDRSVSAFRRVTTAQANKAHEERFFTIDFYNDDGTANIRGRVPAEVGELLKRALEFAEERSRNASEADPDAEVKVSSGACRADALAWLVDAAMASPDAARTGGDRTQVVVHVDVETLAAPTTPVVTEAEPHCELASGVAISPETVRRLCCDAAIVTALEHDGTTLSVGRSTRSIPPSIRRALRARQPTCQFPGCSRNRWLDAHHIQHWAHGGHTRLDNLVHLCHHHHQLVHEGGYEVRGFDPDGSLNVCTDRGRRLTSTPPPRRGDCMQVLDTHARRGIDPSHATIGSLTYTANPDMGRCVDALLHFTADPEPL